MLPIWLLKIQMLRTMWLKRSMTAFELEQSLYTTEQQACTNLYQTTPSLQHMGSASPNLWKRLKKFGATKPSTQSCKLGGGNLFIPQRWSLPKDTPIAAHAGLLLPWKAWVRKSSGCVGRSGNWLPHSTLDGTSFGKVPHVHWLWRQWAESCCRNKSNCFWFLKCKTAW